MALTPAPFPFKPDVVEQYKSILDKKEAFWWDPTELEQEPVKSEFLSNLRHYLEPYVKSDRANAFPNLAELTQFLSSGADLYARSNEWGHLTGSAWIVNHDISKVLLIMHGKLKIWVAPGGHVDPGETPYEAAMRESAEEVGIPGLKSFSGIFDVDVHRIPYSAKKNEPEHWHADVRYMVIADRDVKIELNLDECDDVQWVPLKDLTHSEDAGLKRMAIKTLIIRQSLDIAGIIPPLEA